MSSNDVSHMHDWIVIGRYDDVPCVEGSTKFFVVRCVHCGHVEPFPAANYRLTTDAFKAEFARQWWG